MFPIFLKNVSLPFLWGGYPRNVNESAEITATDNMAVIADAPGIGTRDAPASHILLTSRAPGSETAGVPASETRAKLLPSFISERTFSAVSSSVFASHRHTGFRIS